MKLSVMRFYKNLTKIFVVLLWDYTLLDFDGLCH